MNFIFGGEINAVVHLAKEWRHFFYGITIGQFGFGFILRRRILGVNETVKGGGNGH